MTQFYEIREIKYDNVFLIFLAPTYRKSFPVKLSACWKPDVCGALGKDDRQCWKTWRLSRDVTTSINIDGRGAFAAVNEPSLLSTPHCHPLHQCSNTSSCWAGCLHHGTPLPTQQHLAHVLAQQEETLAQVVQRSCGYPSPGSVQVEAGQSFQQPGPAEGIPAHGRGVRTNEFLGSFLTLKILWLWFWQPCVGALIIPAPFPMQEKNKG